MKKFLALLLSLVAVFSLATACTPDSDLSGVGSSQESGITGGSSDTGSSDTGSSDTGSSGGGSTVVPPITDGGNFDGGDY